MATLTFWGVQGSCAGNNNNDYGSNTSCISIEVNKQHYSRFRYRNSNTSRTAKPIRL